MIDKEKDLIELLDILVEVIEANRGLTAVEDSRVLDAEGLAIKFYGHTISTLYLYRGVNIPDLSVPVKTLPDPSSVDVLVRAAFESFLVFYYIFIESSDKNEIDLKYYAWELAGLYERQKFPATLEENIKKLEREKELIEKLKEKINKNSIFKSFSKNQKNSFLLNLKKSKWRSKGWAQIALSAGLSELNSKVIYSFLCEHAHSGNISATQVSQSSGFIIRRQLMEGAIGQLIICVANMIKYYCQYFTRSREFYVSNFKEPNIVTFWLDIGANKID